MPRLESAYDIFKQNWKDDLFFPQNHICSHTTDNEMWIWKNYRLKKPYFHPNFQAELIYKTLWIGAEAVLTGQECPQLLQSYRVQFPTFMLGGSQPNVIPASEDQTPFSDLCRKPHTNEYTHI